MTTQDQPIDPILLERLVSGRGLRGPTLGENLTETTLLVFLRHFG